MNAKSAKRFVAIGLSVLLAGCASLPPPVTENYEAKFDRFHQAMTYSWFAYDSQYGKPRVGFIAVKKDAPPSSVLTTIRVSTPRWTYLKCHNVAMLADGKPIVVGATKHDGNVRSIPGMTVYTDEFISFRLSTQEAKKLASAGTAEYQLCGDEFVLDSKDQAALQRILLESGA